MKRLTFLMVLAALGCAPDQPGFPLVQPSVTGKASRTISFNRSLSGSFRAISPRCDIVRPGWIVEFRNYSPDLSVLVTGSDGPEILYSPNLTAPYNLVTDGDEAYSFWRYAFAAPGVYEFYDAASGDPGRKLVDRYYGTVTFVGTAGNATRGTICVGDDASCAGVCCQTNADCPSGQLCTNGPNGRCLSP